MKKKQESKKLSVILISAFIVFSMVISIFAIVLENNTGDVPDYNGKSFVLTNYGYKTKINSQYMEFYYYPGDLERMNMTPAIKNTIREMTGLGVVFNPYQNVTDNLVYIDALRFDLQTQLDKPTYFGVTNASSNYSSIPTANCSMATSEFPLIIIDTEVNYSNNVSTFEVSDENPYCIVLNAKLRDLLAAKDAIVYTYYGVME